MLSKWDWHILQQNKICVKIGREKYAIYIYYDYMEKILPYAGTFAYQNWM